MNTSVYTTRLLKGLAALAVICVSTQTFAQVKEDFELFSAGYAITNDAAWTAQGSDMSTVIATNYDYTAATMPLSQTYPSTAHTKVLSLDTQGDQLANGEAVMVAPVVYIDQMVYLVPSDETPYSITNDTSIQTAIFLNSSSNLVLMTAGDLSITGTKFETITSTNVLPNTWVRLTVTADYDTGDFAGSGQDLDWFKVAVDGVDLTFANGYSAPTNFFPLFDVTAPDGGPWFMGANNQDGPTMDSLAGISYMGTGMIDDLLVTTVAPTFSGGTPTVFFTITSIVGANGSVSPVGDVEVESGGTTQIVFTAAYMYEIASLDVDGTPVPAAVGALEYTNTYVNVTAPMTNNVTFAVQRTEGAPATWYEGVLGLGLTPTDDGDIYNLFQEYVAGLDPTVNEDFAITSLSKNGSNQLVITWDGADSSAVATRLTVQGAATVGGTPAAIPGAAVFSGVSPNGMWTWTSTDPVPDTVKFLYLSADETPE